MIYVLISEFCYNPLDFIRRKTANRKSNYKKKRIKEVQEKKEEVGVARKEGRNTPTRNHFNDVLQQ